MKILKLDNSKRSIKEVDHEKKKQIKYKEIEFPIMMCSVLVRQIAASSFHSLGICTN